MGLRLYRIGAWSWIITGVVHDAGDVLSRLFPSPAKEPLRTALRQLSFEFLGMRNDYYRLTMGFSLAMGASIALAGMLFLLIARMAMGSADRVRPACWVGLVASMTLLGLSVAVLQLPPPVITFTLASLSFAAALLAEPRSGGSPAKWTAP